MGGFLHHWLFEDFWVLVWPNVGAVPLCAAASVIGVYCFRKPLERLWQRIRASMHEPLRAEIAELRAVADRAHRIAADSYRHTTGREHPDAPGRRGGQPTAPRKPAKPNGSSERLATRDERTGSQPTVTDSRQLRDPKGRFL
jgi:hypothetical protein